MGSVFHCVDSCNKCSKENDVEVIGTIYEVSEARTVCKECGHIDYWSYGYFESSEHMESKCKTYSFDNKTGE